MPDVDRLLAEYIEQHRAGANPDASAYLEQLEGTDRRELEALIDGYLIRAPRKQWKPERYQGSLAERVVQRYGPALTGGTGLWPAILPELRAAAQLKRSEVVARLAQELAVAEQEEKVERYYHQMEQGLLPPQAVSQRVLEALGSIVGRSGQWLRRMGEALEPGGAAGAPEAAFARSAVMHELRQAPQSPAPPAAPAQSAEWDEVDRLFCGGP